MKWWACTLIVITQIAKENELIEEDDEIETLL